MLWTHIRLLRGFEDPQHYKNRYGIPTRKRPKGPLIWIHVASVGEAVSILPLIESLKKMGVVLITTTTLGGKKILAQRLNMDDGNTQIIHQYIPFDTQFWVKRFLNFWQPNICLFVESEIWPITLLSINTRHIPVLLLNARLSQRALVRWLKYPAFARRVFSTFNACTTSSKDLTNSLMQLGTKNIRILPHLKYAATPLPYDESIYHFYQNKFTHRPIWVAASTHEGEEEIVIKAHQKLRHDFPNLLTIIVPRHPVRTKNIEALLIPHQISYITHSNRHLLNEQEVLIVDAFGALGLFYALTRISLVAGNLVPHIGGHNPIEPALFGHAVLWGPYHHKSQDVCDTLKTAAFEIHHANQLYDVLFDLLSHPEKCQKQGEMIKNIVAQQGQSLQETIALNSYLHREKIRFILFRERRVIHHKMVVFFVCLHPHKKTVCASEHSKGRDFCPEPLCAPSQKG